MSKIRYLLAAMVGASLTASCGVVFRPADQQEAAMTQQPRPAVAGVEEEPASRPRGQRAPY